MGGAEGLSATGGPDSRALAVDRPFSSQSCPAEQRAGEVVRAKVPSSKHKKGQQECRTREQLYFAFLSSCLEIPETRRR